MPVRGLGETLASYAAVGALDTFLTFKEYGTDDAAAQTGKLKLVPSPQPLMASYNELSTVAW